jgi:hypothetical protein
LPAPTPPVSGRSTLSRLLLPFGIAAVVALGAVALLDDTAGPATGDTTIGNPVVQLLVSPPTAQLFLQGKPEEVAANVEALRQGRSMLDFVGGQTKRLNRSLPKADQQRMDQYYTSVRELEQRLHNSEAWEYTPKPVVKAQPPTDVDDKREFVRRTQLTLDVVNLALETDSTRFVTFFIDTTVIHGITHHGNRPEMIAELRRVEEMQFAILGEFLAALDGVREGTHSLLDRTMVLHGSCMGNANAHSNSHLPVLVAGGGFRHAGHLVFAEPDAPPLANLYVSLLQRLGQAP